MQLDVLLTNTKWEILTELSKESKSPMELAEFFGTSIANISQQLRLMEAMDFIGKNKISNSKKGKPRTKYFIKNETIYFVRLGKGIATKQTINIDPFNVFTFNVFTFLPKKEHYYFLKFFWKYAEILISSSISIFKSTDESIELFIIASDLENIREKLSNTLIIHPNKGKRKIICWTHNISEITDGLKTNNPHFINLVKESSILLDTSDHMKKFKGEVKI